MADKDKERFIDWITSRLTDSSHAQKFEEFTFENFDPTDRIVVTNNLNETIKVVDDPAAIQAVLTFLKSHAAGWTVPAEGVPVARLRLNFYTGSKILGNLGVGRTFLTVHQAGSFWSKASTQTDYFQLQGLIGS
jgi:hypothetical protein